MLKVLMRWRSQVNPGISVYKPRLGLHHRPQSGGLLVLGLYSSLDQRVCVAQNQRGVRAEGQSTRLPGYRNLQGRKQGRLEPHLFGHTFRKHLSSPTGILKSRPSFVTTSCLFWTTSYFAINNGLIGWNVYLSESRFKLASWKVSWKGQKPAMSSWLQKGIRWKEDSSLLISIQIVIRLVKRVENLIVQCHQEVNYFNLSSIVSY